jgi:thiol-disulfide isomerase/thioredoxin
MMKKLIGWIKEIVLALLMLTIILNIISFLKKPDLASSSLPSFELTTIEKKEINSNIYKNKPLMIHFWATWCPTCKLEASTIESLSKEYEVLSVAVNSGDDDEIKLFMDSHKLSYDVINDKNGEFAKKFSVFSFPTTFIYDKDAKIKFSEVGYSSTLGLKLRMWLAK